MLKNVTSYVYSLLVAVTCTYEYTAQKEKPIALARCHDCN